MCVAHCLLQYVVSTLNCYSGIPVRSFVSAFVDLLFLHSTVDKTNLAVGKVHLKLYDKSVELLQIDP